MRSWSIYALSDPRNGDVRYVGWTVNPKRRLRDHLSESRRKDTYRARWIRALSSLGLVPVMTVLEPGVGETTWAEAETRWIAHYRDNGARLTNATDGGEGCVGLVVSAETRAKQSAAKKGRKLPPEHIEKTRKGNTGQKRTVAQRQNMSRSRLLMRHRHTTETKTLLSAAGLGRRHSVTTRVKIGLAGRGRRQTEAAKAKQRRAKLGKSLTLQHRQKLSVAKLGGEQPFSQRMALSRSGRGRHHTDETRSLMSQRRRASGVKPPARGRGGRTWKQEDMDAAVRAWLAGEGSLKRMAVRFGVPRSSLVRYTRRAAA